MNARKSLRDRIRKKIFRCDLRLKKFEDRRRSL